LRAFVTNVQAFPKHIAVIKPEEEICVYAR
jgi:hypothetical protein